MNDWHYSGDVDLQYGGTFIRDKGHYFDVVEVTDLASACGANDLYLIESGHTSHEYYKRSEITTALDSCGPGRGIYKLGQTSRATSRLIIAEALWSYGRRDIDTSVVLYDADNSAQCAHCGEDIVYRNGKCQHAESGAYDDDYATCMLGTPDKPDDSKHAEPKTPVSHENGHESWPDLLDDDWRNYADGEAGLRRYLSDRFGIDPKED